MTSGWFGVRCVVDLGATDGVTHYEERVTLWEAADAEEAIALAEAEASEYARDLDARYAGLAQAYILADVPGQGAEVFSLIRDSTLSGPDYLNAFFDTGAERTR